MPKLSADALKARIAQLQKQLAAVETSKAPALKKVKALMKKLGSATRTPLKVFWLESFGRASIRLNLRSKTGNLIEALLIFWPLINFLPKIFCWRTLAISTMTI